MSEEITADQAHQLRRAQEQLDQLRRDIWRALHPDSTDRVEHTSAEVVQALIDRLKRAEQDKLQRDEFKQEVVTQVQQLSYVGQMLTVWREHVLTPQRGPNKPTPEQTMLALTAPVTHLLLAAERGACIMTEPRRDEPDNGRWVCEEIERLMVADVEALLGRPLTPQVASLMHTDIATSIAKLARVVASLLPEPEPEPAQPTTGMAFDRALAVNATARDAIRRALGQEVSGELAERSLRRDLHTLNRHRPYADAGTQRRQRLPAMDALTSPTAVCHHEWGDGDGHYVPWPCADATAVLLVHQIQLGDVRA